MLERLVVPLDGSRLAEVALPYAEEVAAKMGSDIFLFTVLETEGVAELEKHQTYIKKVAELTKRHAAKYTLNNGAREIKVEAATRTGNPAEAIIDYAGGYQLIIMASHGRSGVSRWAVGSVADKVVRATARQPVMLIRTKESRSDIREKRILKKVLVPLDGSIGSRLVLPYISKIAAKLEMELTLLQVVPKKNQAYKDAEAYLQRECKNLKDAGVSAECKVGVGAVADKIIDLADEDVFDLVAMSTHGRTGLSRWSLGSVAEKVFMGGSTPLLLVKQ